MAIKKTYRKNIVRTVRQTLSRFGAIFAIVALGVGFLAGLLATTPDMYETSDTYFDETHFYDLRVLGTLGITQDDVDEISKIDGISDMMPSYFADALATVPGSDDTLVIRFHSLPVDEAESKEPQGYINRIEITDGRLPVKDDECVVVESASLLGYNISIGDTVTLANDSDGLAQSEFKVTGLAKSSNYFSVERDSSNIGSGTVHVQAYTGEQNFTSSVYSEVYLSVDGAEQLDTFSDEYIDLVDSVADKIDAISGKRCEIRYNDVKTQAEETLADAKQKYEDAKAEADEKLGDARTQLDDGQAQIDENEKKLEDAKQQIEDGEKELANTQGTLTSTLTDKQAQLIAGKQALIDAKAQYEAAKAELEKSEEQVTTLKIALAAAKAVTDRVQPTVQGYQGQLDMLKPQLEQYEQSLTAANTAYLAAQLELDTAMSDGGYATEDDYLTGDPINAVILIGKRNAAQTTLTVEQAKYDAANSSYNSVYNTLVAANNDLAEAQRQIEDYTAQITSAEAQITSGKTQLAAAQKQILEGEKQVTSGETALTLAPDLARLQIELSQLMLESSKQQIADGETQLEEAKQQLADSEAEYEKQKKSVEEQLADAKQQLDDGEEQLAKLEMPKWLELTRSQNISYASLESNITKVEAVVKVFPVFFFLVAALVALTTMTRMVEEERLQIGTLKALGFAKRTIMLKYIFYAMAASVSGSVIGLLIGFKLFPTVIWNAYSLMYALPGINAVFRVNIAAMAAGAAILCTLAATLNAAWATLSETPAQLMRPRAPKAGKRILLEHITPVWKRLPFTYKVTARNLFRYKKRFLMTVVGISGCTALLVCGFGLHDSISDIVNVQFGQVFTYDVAAGLSDVKALDSTKLKNVLSDVSVDGYMAAHTENGTYTVDGKEHDVSILVPENDVQFPQFVHLRHRIGHDAVQLTSLGIVITEKMSELTGCGIGEQIEIADTNGDTAVFTVTGVAENYVGSYAYMTAETYEEKYGEAPEFSGLYVKLAENTKETREALASKMLEVSEVSGISFIDDLKTTFSDMMGKIDIIVVVLIISAGALAFIVLYNLTNININERAKEIATIKVLGFFDKEVYSYVYRETIVLSIIGTIVGLILGVFLHKFVIYEVEVDVVMFGRSIKAQSYLFSAALTMLFSVFVELVMRRKLRNISMVESMKAPE